MIKNHCIFHSHPSALPIQPAIRAQHRIIAPAVPYCSPARAPRTAARAKACSTENRPFKTSACPLNPGRLVIDTSPFFNHNSPLKGANTPGTTFPKLANVADLTSRRNDSILYLAGEVYLKTPEPLCPQHVRGEGGVSRNHWGKADLSSDGVRRSEVAAGPRRPTFSKIWPSGTSLILCDATGP